MKTHLKVVQVKSLIGQNYGFRLTAQALGLTARQFAYRLRKIADVATE